jgi:O-antigen/teichoic acid export membrane protein
LPVRPATEPGAVTWSRFWQFALFMFTFEVSHYFETPGFASPALAAATGGAAMVALFNVAFQVPMMVVVVILSGLQGVYRPLFARVMAEKAPERVRTAFAEISKVQAALLIPAGVGLILMLPDYIPLLFTDRFHGAVPLAQILCALIFFETLFNLGNILLSVDHRYAIVLAAHAVRIAAAPVFVWLALRGDMVLATIAFGAGRVLASGLGHVVAHRAYGVRFPVAFTARVCLSTAMMAIVVGAGRLLLPSSWPATVSLTAVGAALTVLGARWFAVLGPRELDILHRAGLPGGATLIAWLAPPRRAS